MGDDLIKCGRLKFVKGKVMGVVGMPGVGRVVESLSLKYLSKRSGSSPGVIVEIGALSERTSSWAESMCVDLLSLSSLSNL